MKDLQRNCANPDYKFKWAPEHPTRENGRGRVVDPATWSVGPDRLLRDKYYSWLRHKSQAAFRGEDHEITWEQWQELWTDENWFQRGRSQECLMLVREDNEDGWYMDNVVIVQAKDKGKYYKNQGRKVNRV